MKKKTIFLVVLTVMLMILLLTGCRQGIPGGQQSDDPNGKGPSDESVEINISAAASLTEALTEISTEYAKQSNAVLQFNFAASGTLQKQIEEGAPCDIFISASKAHMDKLQDAGIIIDDSRTDLLGNSLTLIAAAEKADVIAGFNSLIDGSVESLSIGEPDSVPAGKYAKEALENLGIWNDVEGKIVYAKDVKQVLEYVETGNVDCGLVYRSDALLLDTGKIIEDASEDSHAPIVYPAALIANSDSDKAAAEFFRFLVSDFSKTVFGKYGFMVL